MRGVAEFEWSEKLRLSRVGEFGGRAGRSS